MFVQSESLAIRNEFSAWLQIYDDVISSTNSHNTFQGDFYHSVSPMRLVPTRAYHGNNSWFVGIPTGCHSPLVIPLPLPLSFQKILNLPQHSLSLDYKSETTGFQRRVQCASSPCEICCKNFTFHLF